MSEVLAHWNALPAAEAENEILTCCGSQAWADGMVSGRPITGREALLAHADEIWRMLAAEDWMEAFRSHPRIGETRGSQHYSQADPALRSSQWSEGEQSRVTAADDTLKTSLARANREYEAKFGHIFIVCASSKSGVEILQILERRMRNDAVTELREAAGQQRQITRLRLEKWLAE